MDAMIACKAVPTPPGLFITCTRAMRGSQCSFMVGNAGGYPKLLLASPKYTCVNRKSKRCGGALGATCRDEKILVAIINPPQQQQESEENHHRRATMSGKKVADVATKAAAKIDWDGMAKMVVSEEARKEFFNLRRTFEDVNHALQTKFSMEPVPMDWEKYRKGIGSKLVDMYKEAYESIEIPKYVDTVTPQYKPKFDALLAELKEAEQMSLKESERLEKEIEEVRELKTKISTMTADEYFEKHPELRKKFDDEMRNDYWGY